MRRSCRLPRRPTLAIYERTFHALGPTVDRFGLGTWAVGASDAADVANEPVDHIFVTARLSAVRRVLPSLLERCAANSISKRNSARSSAPPFRRSAASARWLTSTFPSTAPGPKRWRGSTASSATADTAALRRAH